MALTGAAAAFAMGMAYHKGRQDGATQDEFDVVTSMLEKQVRVWLETYYGPKCKDFEPECICCRNWKAYEELFGDETISR